MHVYYLIYYHLNVLNINYLIVLIPLEKKMLQNPSWHRSYSHN